MVKINKKLFDIWSLPHFAAGYIFGRHTEFNTTQFAALNLGFEIFEHFLKKQYDIFSIPFGKETVYECPSNSVMDWLIAEAGYFSGMYMKLNLRPAVNYMASLNRQNLIVAEVGSFCGRNALNMFNKLDVGHMYLIDPYTNYEGYDDYLNRSDLNPTYLDAKNRLRLYEDKTTFIPKFSSDAVDDIPDNVDFIYIDGNHGYEYVIQDMELYYPKVRPGGVLGGHDYSGYFPGVKQAAHEFADKYTLELYQDNIDWWVIKK